jgi:tetratricopeptide (TPR) repeat protein
MGIPSRGRRRLFHFSNRFSRAIRNIPSRTPERGLASADRLRSLVPGAIWDINAFDQLMRIAVGMLSGELAATEGDYDRAVALLRKAAATEDDLAYQEPPDWFFPARHSLGAVLIEAGRFKEAEAVYREDLKRYPQNGWSLRGLVRCMEGMGKTQEAKTLRAQFEKAWAWADIPIDTSRL